MASEGGSLIGKAFASSRESADVAAAAIAKPAPELADSPSSLKGFRREANLPAPKSGSQAENMQDKPVFLTVIGIRSASTIDPDDISATLKALDPARNYEVVAVPTPDGRQGAGLIVNVEGVQFTVFVGREAVHAQAYAAAARAAALTWTGAASAVEKAEALIIVAANQPAGDHAAAVRIAFLLTVLTTAAAARAKATFIYWGTADLLVEPSAFATATDAMLSGNQPPILQWVRFDLFRGPELGGKATGGMRSAGLASFVGYELQLNPVSMSPVEIARRTIGFVEHLVREGPAEAGGSIDGPRPGERIEISKRVTDQGTVAFLSIQN